MVFFQDAEVRAGILEAIKKHEFCFASQLHAAASPRIKEKFVAEWVKRKKGKWWYPDAYVDSDKPRLRTRLGLPDR